MVLFKRTPIERVPLPRGLDRDASIWVLEGTGEAFTSYDEYLDRYDYYMQKKFTCEITGHTGLTYWDASKSEKDGSRDVETNFPERLRGPVLNKVNFSTISRIDELVAWLFDSFKDDFFPGERVYVHVADSNDRAEGTIREKTTFPEHRRLDGTMEREEMVRYFITLDRGNVAVQDQKHITRGRRMFTKHVLRSFLKNTITRDRFEGAPWIVKEPYASEHGISTQIPPHLRHEVILREKKTHAVFKKANVEEVASDFFIDESGHVIPRPGTNFNKHQIAQLQSRIDNVLTSSTSKVASASKNSNSQRHSSSKGQRDEPKLLHLEPPKFPIEDLDLAPNKANKQRPRLRTIPEYMHVLEVDTLPTGRFLNPASIGLLLEIWNTLTVFGEFFCLSSFTFDDFVQATVVASEAIDCELYREVHCAIVKKLINASGDILSASLEGPSPQSSESPESSPEGSETSDRDSEQSSQLEGARLSSESNTNHVQHQAQDILSVEAWKDRLRMRRFPNGGWQLILIGILERLCERTIFKAKAESVLADIVSGLGAYTNLHDICLQYWSLDINLRISVLELITMLATETKPFKEFMDRCTRESTETRKEKTKLQSMKKHLISKLAQLDQERKLLRPDDLGEAGKGNDGKNHTINKVSKADREASPVTEYSSVDSDDDAPPSAHASRRFSDRHATIKRKREELEELEEQELKKRMNSKEAAKYTEILESIREAKEEMSDINEQIAEKDDELRENNCHRTRSLGIDRFENRYIWFERNGMPLKGDPYSSSASALFANGRIWVHGPYKLNSQGLLDTEQGLVGQHGMTLKERRELEEGSTVLKDANHWGWYGTVEDLQSLIDWLDHRGERERPLRKELLWWQEEIVDCIERRERHYADRAAKQAAKEERSLGVATRKKTNQDHWSTKYQCLSWRNTLAIASLKHLHSDEHYDALPPTSQKRSKRTIEIRLKQNPEATEKRSARQGGRSKG